MEKEILKLIREAETDIANRLNVLQRGVADALRKHILEEREEEEPDHWAERQRDLKLHVEELPEISAEGYDCYDPRTDERYLTCLSCGLICELEEYHSGGECNLCHAVNKDD